MGESSSHDPAPLPPPGSATEPTVDLDCTRDLAPTEESRPTDSDSDNKRDRLATIPGYVILGVLGRGGMGIVYKATQVGLNRLVALKMILSGPHASDREVGRFRL